MQVEKLVVIGVGLIGASCALALRAAGGVRHVVGVGRSPENLQRALARGVIDGSLSWDGQNIDMWVRRDSAAYSPGW